jgi:hypothetical protein
VIVSLSGGAPVQPVPSRPAESPVAPATEVPPAWDGTATSAQLAEVIRAITPAASVAPAASRPPFLEPPPEAIRTMFVRGPSRAKSSRASRPGSGSRVLGPGALALALALVLAVLAAYLIATVL